MVGCRQQVSEDAGAGHEASAGLGDGPSGNVPCLYLLSRGLYLRPHYFCCMYPPPPYVWCNCSRVDCTSDLTTSAAFTPPPSLCLVPLLQRGLYLRPHSFCCMYPPSVCLMQLLPRGLYLRPHSFCCMYPPSVCLMQLLPRGLCLPSLPLLPLHVSTSRCLM